ncbi:hypothetical protein NQ317_017696 [Molorchus minor]|uniref:2',5'-phosphodiesterase 12 n=1 Tax=Molorchus minor TaxID=1323400 RepID=A0ABQ9JMT6_9CUCU|nr:hypothetical protein NQ317_017696 [Molorchus minor]
MFLRLHKILADFHRSAINKNIHKYIFKMDHAYLRRLSDNEQFLISFKYKNEELKVERQFNFNRKLAETVDTFLSRVVANVEKSVCDDIFQPKNNIVLKVREKDYNVIVNSPWVDTIELPLSILANFPVYSSKFETVYTDKDQPATFTWFKSSNQVEWTEAGHEYIFTPTNEDVGCYLKLKCVPRNGDIEGPEVEVISTCKVEASPGLCPFEVRHRFTKCRAEGREFRVVTYNILADLYCDSDYTREILHPYCPAYALKIDYRKLLILKEIIGYNADLICLQEVDRKVYSHDLAPALHHLGFDSDFAEIRFQKLASKCIVFSEHISRDPQFADVWEKISRNEKLSERILGRKSTLQVNVIESLEHEEVLVVANTHFYFHPDADHIRLLHGGLAIRYLENYINDLKKEITNKRISLIFCGDFNSVPECGVYKLYTTGTVPKDCIDYSSNSEQTVQDVEFTQNLQLGSACGTPKYTNFTAGFADCLDYIFYEKSNLAVTQVVPLPSHEEVTQNTALPSVVFPSDHIALVSDLKWL